MSEIAVIGDYDVRDKKLADAGTGTSVASTDAVVLKDTNGNYVEIDRDSFTDAIRSALGPILTNMTQKTAASGGVVVNDSNDVGTMNLSNLASVMGEYIKNFPIAFTDSNPSTKVIEMTTNLDPGQFLIIEVVALHTNDELAYSRIISSRWNYRYTKIISEIDKNSITIAYKDDNIYIRYNKSSYGRVYVRTNTEKSLQYTFVSAIPSDATIVQ